ncbi:hypothetical protein T4B_9155 [Trichinella pseudospiralis]|uniref:Uncharacterized protein n=1 Tax=Trichinella pseudospiralis TaxID=6337 RepID=A0A0V1ILJ5_TRIPS|nr:hypothetical protein T4B_9155 [Trichinella pseudospiralis]
MLTGSLLNRAQSDEQYVFHMLLKNASSADEYSEKEGSCEGTIDMGIKAQDLTAPFVNLDQPYRKSVVL